MKDLVVMYHYVRKRGEWKGIFPLDPLDFEKQIDQLSKKFTFVLPDEINSIKGTKPYCILTFDDGTKDHYEIAFKILKEKGIPGFFAVMSGPHMHKKIPVVHLIHSVLSFISDDEIWSGLCEKFNTRDVPFLVKQKKIYEYDTDLRRYTKYVLNFMLSEAEASSFLENYFNQIFPDKRRFIEEFYINKENIKEMMNSGMGIGVHANHHLPFNGSAEQFFSEEIKPCVNYLVDEFGIKSRWYIPAYGGGINVREMKKDLTPILKANGFKGAFSTVPGYNTTFNNYWFNRFDCIDLPPFKSLP